MNVSLSLMIICFGLKFVVSGLITLHNQELFSLYCVKYSSHTKIFRIEFLEPSDTYKYGLTILCTVDPF